MSQPKTVKEQTERRNIVSWLGWKASSTWYTNSNSKAISPSSDKPEWAHGEIVELFDWSENWERLMYLYGRMLKHFKANEDAWGELYPNSIARNSKEAAKYDTLTNQLMAAVMECKRTQAYKLMLTIIEIEQEASSKLSNKKTRP